MTKEFAEGEDTSNVARPSRYPIIAALMLKKALGEGTRNTSQSIMLKGTQGSDGLLQ
jgi:hypothetical protein